VVGSWAFEVVQLVKRSCFGGGDCGGLGVFEVVFDGVGGWFS